MKHEWGRKEEEIKKLKNKHSFHKHIAKWPHLEAELKNWITGHRNK
jgi:hypothetical protein